VLRVDKRPRSAVYRQLAVPRQSDPEQPTGYVHVADSDAAAVSAGSIPVYQGIVHPPTSRTLIVTKLVDGTAIALNYFWMTDRLRTPVDLADAEVVAQIRFAISNQLAWMASELSSACRGL
jgi:hypothetical protein